jgi:multiple sugar transport system permease protein
MAWLSSTAGAFFVVTMVMLWKGYPFISIMLLAGLQAIPGELYEAAEIDGAGSWQRFRYVTLPGLRPVTGVALVLILLWVFRDFPVIWILTQGGPLGATRTLAIITYEEAFGFFNMGYAAALGVITLIISIIASVNMIRRISVEFY